jgi:predicted acylesterase/phospholipase RssA
VRPTIGLALGGGGARGFAHIGVLRTLLAHGIEPDIIVGTSIGAVVGGCHAAGRLDVIEEWARGMTKRGILGYLDISLTGGGLIGGSKLAARLEEKLGNTPIEALPIRFATITTEVGTGHEIWLTRGRLVDAMRASYALPGIFPPVLLDGRWLVDGALVNPVPVSATRVFGARLVIAVNLSTDILGRSMIMAGEGAEPEQPPDPVPERGGFPLDIRLRARAQTPVRRRAPPPRHSERDDRCLQHHAGSHRAGAARRRSAGRHDQSAGRPHRLVRLSTALRRRSRSAPAPPSGRSMTSARPLPRSRHGQQWCRRP